MLSVSVKNGRFEVFQIRRNFQIDLWPCTICCKTADIKSHRIAHNVACRVVLAGRASVFHIPWTVQGEDFQASATTSFMT